MLILQGLCPPCKGHGPWSRLRHHFLGGSKRKSMHKGVREPIYVHLQSHNNSCHKKQAKRTLPILQTPTLSRGVGFGLTCTSVISSSDSSSLFARPVCSSNRCSCHSADSLPIVCAMCLRFCATSSMAHSVSRSSLGGLRSYTTDVGKDARGA